MKNPDGIPAHLIADILADWYDRQDDPEANLMGLAHAAFASETELSDARRYGRLYDIMRGRQNVVGFDTADAILCSLGLRWDATPGLQEAYDNYDFTLLDYTVPTCEAVARANRKKIARMYGAWRSHRQVAERLGISVFIVRRELDALKPQDDLMVAA